MILGSTKVVFHGWRLLPVVVVGYGQVISVSLYVMYRCVRLDLECCSQRRGPGRPLKLHKSRSDILLEQHGTAGPMDADVVAGPRTKPEGASKRKKAKEPPAAPPRRQPPPKAKRTGGASSSKAKQRVKEDGKKADQYAKKEDEYFEEEEDFDEDYDSYEPYDRVMASGASRGPPQPILMPPGVQRGRMEGQNVSPARENGYRLASVLAGLLWEMKQHGHLDVARASRVL